MKIKPKEIKLKEERKPKTKGGRMVIKKVRRTSIGDDTITTTFSGVRIGEVFLFTNPSLPIPFNGEAFTKASTDSYQDGSVKIFLSEQGINPSASVVVNTERIGDILPAKII